METSLHQDLKRLYADDDAQVEVRVGRYRIDAVVGERLIEIQHASLSSIRRKVARLVESHCVLVVKPVVIGKQLVKCRRKGGQVVDRRRSPKRGQLLDLFHELVYFAGLYPHPQLEVEAVAVDVEEWRYPAPRRRRRRRDFAVADQRLLEVGQTLRLRTADDLLRLLPDMRLPEVFHTGHLAAALGIDRWVAQRIAYCFRKMGTADVVGKQGNAWLYQLAERPRADRAA